MKRIELTIFTTTLLESESDLQQIISKVKGTRMVHRKLAYLFLVLLTWSCDSSEPIEVIEGFETATRIDAESQTQGNISLSGEQDFFSFQLDQVAVVDISIDPVPEDQTLFLRLFDGSKKQIADTFGVDSSGEDNGLALHLTTVTLEAQEYFVAISQHAGEETSDKMYTLNIAVDTRDQNEYNDSIEDATELALGQVVVGTLRMPHDIDFYAFNLPMAGAVDILMDEVPRTVPLEIVLFQNGTLLRIYGTGYVGGSRYEYDYVEEAGLYHIAINCFEGCSTPDAYTLQVNLDSLDEYEPNDFFAFAADINRGVELKAYLKTTDDRDFYKLSVATRTGTFILTNESDKTLLFQFFDANETLIDSSEVRGGRSRQKRISNPALPGLVYVLVTRTGIQSRARLPYRILMTEAAS